MTFLVAAVLFAVLVLWVVIVPLAFGVVRDVTDELWLRDDDPRRTLSGFVVVSTEDGLRDALTRPDPFYAVSPTVVP